MVFSSPLFLFLVLPVILAAYFAVPASLRTGRNLLLFAISLAFYTWGEGWYLFVLLGSLIVNYGLARLVDASPRQRWLWLAVVLNLGVLGFFKYKAFLVANLSLIGERFGLSPFAVSEGHLPIGISFFTFQAMSYVIDVYRREVPAQRSFLQFGLYVFLFPHLIAGPIVRYSDIAAQLGTRPITGDSFALGIQRFILGLAKKMLLANTLAETADAIFNLPAHELNAASAWLGIICYTLQIYFDFSGYSDMAIGLGKMFGFDFLENFRHPYIATSVTDFWRRWHISLSTWFRDYLYIPLGGNRHGPVRTYANLLIVFLLCGLWHGASWTFMLWGLFHGLFLVIERLGLGKLLEQIWSPLRHGYVILAVMVGWVFFRAVDVQHGWTYLSAMLGYGSGVHRFSDFWHRELAVVLPLAVLAATPIRHWLSEKIASRPLWDGISALSGSAALMGLLLLATVRMNAGGYSPFIYFRF